MKIGKAKCIFLASFQTNAWQAQTWALQAQHHLLPNRPTEIVDRKIIALHKHNWFRMCFQASIP